MKNKIKIYYEIFYFLSISLLIFLLLEIIFPNYILAYFNINVIFSLCIINFFLLLIFKNFYSNHGDKK